MEDWKIGRLEEWKIGRMEDWKDGHCYRAYPHIPPFVSRREQPLVENLKGIAVIL